MNTCHDDSTVAAVVQNVLTVSVPPVRANNPSKPEDFARSSERDMVHCGNLENNMGISPVNGRNDRSCRTDPDHNDCADLNSIIPSPCFYATDVLSWHSSEVYNTCREDF